MEIAIAILVVWAIVTVLGHGSWVVVRGVLRWIADMVDPSPPLPKFDQNSDIAATRRIISYLMHKKMLDPSEASTFQKHLRNLEYGQWTSPIHPPAEDVDAAPSTDEEPASTPQREVPAEQPPLVASLVEDLPSKTDGHRAGEITSRAKISGTASSAPSQTSAAESPVGVKTPAASLPEPSPPVLSRSEIIQSFLAAHNIRWGELVAGLLIVVCSIGLVISLWSPLVETHRVIPSLIFLGANAAIYAAGLYTLSRWRLRHTSRAVLVIATLLVPLSVLAGLAAAGTGEDAVHLNDPITLAAIGLAGAVYTFLVYRGGKALTRRRFAVSIAMVVAGPVSLLPFVPAAVRTFNANAGWMIALGSLAVLLASLRLVHSDKEARRWMGYAGGRARLLVMGFAGFSLAVAIGYAAFALRGFGSAAMLPIAIAAIPALVALAGSSRALMVFARRSTQSMTGAVACVILIAMAWVILPASMSAAHWVWAWAGAFTTSAVLIGVVFRQSQWLPLATFPIGMAATFSSPIWLGDQSWSSISFWQRMIGGEPMIAASLMSIAVAASTRITVTSEQRGWMRFASLVWAGLAVTIASFLAVAPARTLGVAPWWSVSIVLGIGTLTSFVMATRQAGWSQVSVVAATFTWLSVFRPLIWDSSITSDTSIASPNSWMMTTIAIAVTMLAARELIPRLSLRLSGDLSTTGRSSKDWEFACNAAAVVAGTMACVWVGHDWIASAGVLAAGTVVLFWNSTSTRSIESLWLAQLSSFVLVAVVGYGRFEPWLFSGTAWSTGTALWSWAVLGGIVAIGWMLLRHVAKWSRSRESSTVVRRRLRHLNARAAAPSLMVDGWLGCGTTGLIWAATTWSVAAMLCSAAGTEFLAYDAPWTLPLVALVLCGGAAWLLYGIESPRLLSEKLSASLIVVAAVWASTQIAQSISGDVSVQLVVATTLSGLGCALIASAGRWLRGLDAVTLQLASRLSMSVAVCLVAVSSAVLLVDGWFDPILARTKAHPFATLSVVSWWLIGSAATLWIARTSRNASTGIASAVLCPAAVALVVPVYSNSGPIMWFQVAGIASVVWVALTRSLFQQPLRPSIRPAVDGSTVFAMLVGVGSAMLVSLRIVFGLNALDGFFGPAGAVLSTMVVVPWCLGWLRLPGQMDDRLPWPIGLTILAGQLTWLAYMLDLVSGVHTVELLVAIWCLAALASLVRYYFKGESSDFAHIGISSVGVVIVTLVISSRSDLMPWLALASLTISGLALPAVGNQVNSGSTLRAAARLLGWFTIGAGSYFLVARVAAGYNPLVAWTLTVLWSAAWVVLWRVVCPDTSDSERQRRVVVTLPDSEFAVLLMVAAIGETFLFTVRGQFSFQASALGDPLLWARVVAYLAAGASTITRADRRFIWSFGVGTLVAVASLVTVQIAIQLDATPNQRYLWAMLPCGFAVAFIAHWLPGIANSLARWTGGAPLAHLGRLIESTWQVAIAVAFLGTASAIAMMIFGAPPSDIRLTVISVALAAWAIAELAQAADGPRLRHAAVTVALVAIALWASVSTPGSNHPVLIASMQWLVASVFTIPMMLFVFPKLLGDGIATVWREAFQRGATITGVAAIASLITMLASEAAIRGSDGISDIEPAFVIGVAITLGILSGLAGLISILSAPDSTWRERLSLSDSERMVLIIAAQAIGAVTWLHVFLCKPNWAFAGLRGYWPYIVMLLAFVSVGATEWARRRRDELMSNTLSHTALYLPLIPVIGFWLSGGLSEFDWVYRGGKVRYELLLAIGAVYYLVVSSMWKTAIPRVAAIVLGNAAWWVVLVQMPGWGFLAHPQAWMIPPAVCVLVVSHLYRDRLQPAVASGVRYASTLVIYISSTADMLLQQIGTTISGPIILILLALAGMGAGVVLRVRPFLYLGATFVLIGVTSMVWHANRAFDAVWPWWVFGITTGVLLLAALMAIEKNKSRLREYANTLATWQG